MTIWDGPSDEPAKTKTLCLNECATIKTLPWSKPINAKQRPKAELRQHWLRLRLNGIFSSGMMNKIKAFCNQNASNTKYIFFKSK